MQPHHAPDESDDALMKQRIDAICEGMKEAIRLEVQRLRRLGLPVYVYRDGKVVDASKGPTPDVHRQ